MPETTTTKKSAPKGVKTPGKRKGGMNFILLILIIVVIAAFVWAEQQRRSAQSELEQTAEQLQELQQLTQQSGQEVADRVLSSLRTHMDLPEEPQPTVATIVDVERLREANQFYNKAENGDHLVITESRAILYDSDRDIILDVVPVQINQSDTPPADGEGSEGTPVEGEGGGNASPSPGAEVSPDAAASPAAEATVSPATASPAASPAL